MWIGVCDSFENFSTVAEINITVDEYVVLFILLLVVVWFCFK